MKPGIGTRILSTLLRYMPRIGPFKGLGFKNPTPQTEDMYIKSINTTVDQYRAFLNQVRTNTLVLANCDFDTGEPTKAAEYSLTDETYAKLLARLSDRKFDRTSPELRANILAFYSDLSAAIETKKDNVRWQSVLRSLDQLKAAPPSAVVADDATERPALVPMTEPAGTTYQVRSVNDRRVGNMVTWLTSYTAAVAESGVLQIAVGRVRSVTRSSTPAANPCPPKEVNHGAL